MAHDLSSLRPYKNTETLKKSSMTQNKVSFQGLYLHGCCSKLPILALLNSPV